MKKHPYHAPRAPQTVRSVIAACAMLDSAVLSAIAVDSLYMQRAS